MNSALRLPLVALLTALFGCKIDKAPPTGEIPLEEVCAVPSGGGDLETGDANHDGLIDISDGVWTLRYMMNHGAEPACINAQDLLEDEDVDVGDALVLLYQYTLPLKFPKSSKLDCDTITPIADVACGVFDLAFDAPPSVSAAAGATATAQVGVLLTARDLDVQAWTLGVKAEGCTLSGATEPGTVIADHRLDPAGQRDDGFSRADVVDGGLTHVGLLSWKTDVTLVASPDPRRLLALNLEATAPDSGCVPCTLSYTDSLEGPGRVVGLVMTSAGRSYVPSTQTATVDICAQ